MTDEHLILHDGLCASPIIQAHQVKAAIAADRIGYLADLHARDMAQLRFFSHDSPVPGRETMMARARQAGAGYQWVSENIIEARYMAYESRRRYEVIDPARCEFAYADGTPIDAHTYASLAREVIGRWMNSPGHRRNILHRTHRAHGFAIAPNSVRSLCGGLFGVQVMGR